MKWVIASTLMLSMTVAAKAGCDVTAIEGKLSAPLDGLQKTERQVRDIQSTEGGLWRIYRESDGRTHTVIRIDAGESGMSEMRLSILDERRYGITVTRVDYLRHAFIDMEAPNGTARRSTQYFYFCDGAQYLPPPETATPYLGAYEDEGAKAKAAMLSAPEVAEFTRALKR